MRHLDDPLDISEIHLGVVVYSMDGMFLSCERLGIFFLEHNRIPSFDLSVLIVVSKLKQSYISLSNLYVFVWDKTL